MSPSSPPNRARSGSRRAPQPAWRALLSPIGVETPNCPHCGHAFDKMPRRKRICPGCRVAFYSRKRPSDAKKVLMTEADALRGEGQNALLTFKQQDGCTDAALDALVRDLANELGRMPTAEEVVTRHLVNMASAHADQWRWGLYRNARLNLAESCIRQGLLEDALRLYLEVCLLDLNGPSNTGTHDPYITRHFPPFDPSRAYLAPAVIGGVRSTMQDLGLSLDEVKALFDEVAIPIAEALDLPRGPADAWSMLAQELS